jgi:hypothetical protein
MATEIIQAFFFGTSFGERVNGRPVGLTGFAIPDLGVVFRSRHRGGLHECQYVGLLALLKFIDDNQEQLGAYQFEILSDSTLVVYQISHRKFFSSDLAPYYAAAIDYKSKIDYRISWVPRQENIAITGLSETPPLRSDLDLKLDINYPDADKSSKRLSI